MRCAGGKLWRWGGGANSQSQWQRAKKRQDKMGYVIWHVTGLPREFLIFGPFSPSFIWCTSFYSVLFFFYFILFYLILSYFYFILFYFRQYTKGTIQRGEAIERVYGWLRQSRSDPQDEVDDDGNQEEEAEHGWPKAVVVGTRAPSSDGVGSPVVGDQRVDHRAHRKEREQRRGDPANLVAEVEQPNGKRAENDGEVQPREERSLVGKEHLRLDTGRQGNSLTGGCTAGVSSLGRASAAYPRAGALLRTYLSVIVVLMTCCVCVRVCLCLSLVQSDGACSSLAIALRLLPPPQNPVPPPPIYTASCLYHVHQTGILRPQYGARAPQSGKPAGGGCTARIRRSGRRRFFLACSRSCSGPAP